MASCCYSFIKKLTFYIYFVINISLVLSIKSNVKNIHYIPISGNRSIEECINGKPFWDSKSEYFITTSQLIRKFGYSAEEHFLLTKDGYLLTMHRIPGTVGAPPVLLKHGIDSSSFDFVMSGKEYALAFVLADKGYDVWIGNSRGNTYSQCHTKFTTSEYSYWNFSWHEMGIYDLPTEISYITNITNQDIMYIGHSMGTTMFYVFAIERPDIASKVKAMFGLSCVSYISHLKSPLRLYAPFVGLLEIYARITGGALFPQRPLVKIGGLPLYPISFLEKFVASNLFVFLIRSFGTLYSDYTFFHRVLFHTPAGASVKAMIHHLQGINSGRFSYYDYGRKGNLRMYKNTNPPDYDLSKIKVPTAVFWSDSGDMVSEIDSKKLYNEIPNKIILYKVEASAFHHADFLWSKKAIKVLYPKLLSIMERYK